MTNEPATDPPMEPTHGSVVWFESGPELLIKEPDLAVLMVRVGMARNALSSQFSAGTDATSREGAAKIRDLMTSFVTAVAYTNEAVDVASGGLRMLRPLMLRANVDQQIVERVGQLCAGKHPANRILKRARKNLGFHWDSKVIRRSVVHYRRNQRLVWAESSGREGEAVYRLSVDVLGHALFFEENVAGGDLGTAIAQAMEPVVEAMRLMVDFFDLAMHVYLAAHGAVLRELKP
jgi:hypothetical protein